MGPRADITDLVRRVANGPRRARWSAERVTAGFSARSPRQVLADDELPFTGPCADLASVAALELARLGLRPTLVLAGIYRALVPVKFQCGLEVDVDGETWVIGFCVSSTYLYRGRFVETRRRPTILRSRPDVIDPEIPFLAYFEADGRDGVARRVPGYVLERDVAWHGARQGWLRHALARRRAHSAARARQDGRLGDAAGRWD